MILAVGPSLFAANSVEIDQRGELLWNSGGQPYAHKQSLRVEGYLAGDGQAAITALMIALRASLLLPFQDIILYQDDLAPSATKLLNAGSISGVRVTQLDSYPITHGPEYATLRTFNFAAEAEYPLAGTANLLLSWRESMTYSGGGPVYIHLPSINGPSQKQLVCPQMHYSATQEGEAVGYRDYPTPPPPRWPGALKQGPRNNRKAPDRRSRGNYQGHVTTWAYEFESVAPFVGLPTLWLN